MNVLAWILSKTKLGGAFDKVQTFLDGKKSYLVGTATAVPALVNILLSISKDGLPALLNATHTQDWVQLMLGLGMITGRAAIAKAA